MQASKQKHVFHPWLFALNFPGIVVVSNLADLSASVILIVLSSSLLATSILWYIIQRLVRNVYISAAFASLLVATFFLYGQIYVLLFLGFELDFVTDTFLFSLFGILFLITIVVAWRFTAFFYRLTPILNFVSFIFVFSLFVSAIPRLISVDNTEFDIQPVQLTQTATGYDDTLPDVYLIVLDAYPRADVFEDFSGRESFLEDELEQLGFIVASNSKTNYLYTQGLLPTLLNLDYLPEILGEDWDPKANGTQQLDQLIQDNVVCRTFKSIGYKVVTNNSTFGPTRTSDCADEVLSNYNESFELTNIYINTTILRPFLLESVLTNLQESRRKAFDHILTVSEMEEPTFMFAHVLLPHTPYMFDENGDLPPNEGRLSFFMTGNQTANTESEYDAFAEQTIYTAKLTLNTIEQILEQSEVPPIIIILSDHGPDFAFKYTDEYYAQRAPILNAYYLPYAGDSEIYPSISPVNSFRVIFNYYFGADLELLEDRTYVSRFTRKRYYDFHDITTRTLVQNDLAHIGIDWDEQFYEVSQMQNDQRERVLRVYLERIVEENTLVVETSNGWIAEFSVADSSAEIIITDESGSIVIETQSQIDISPDRN